MSDLKGNTLSPTITYGRRPVVSFGSGDGCGIDMHSILMHDQMRS